MVHGHQSVTQLTSPQSVQNLPVNEIICHDMILSTKGGYGATFLLPRNSSRLQLRPFSLPNDGDAEDQQGRQWADSAHSSQQ
eukprot:438984-Prymnesium_polylepis.1